MRELTRVAVADTEREWLELAQGKTVRQLEELVAGKSSATSRQHRTGPWRAGT